MSDTIMNGILVLLGSGIGGIAVWIAARRTALSTEKIANISRDDAVTLSRSENLSSRLTILMDGYEARIKDLTLEVSTLRRRVEHLSQQFDSHSMFCANCPNSPWKRTADAAV